MAFNPNISIDYSVNPRLVNIAAPEVTVTLQDLYDTLMKLQSLPSGIDENNLVSASGLEELGGGVKVGLTVTLLDALVKFEARTVSTVCKIFGGNLVSYNTITEEFLDVPADFSDNVMVTYTSSASATQTDLKAIQYSSFQNAVWVDNTTSTVGTEFPSGTREYPVNNVDDAEVIARERGFDTLQILQSMSMGTSMLDNLKIRGRNRTQTVVYIPPTCSTNNTIFEECYVTGTLSQDVTIRECVAGTLSYLNGYLLDVSIVGNIYLGGNSSAFIVNSGTVDNTKPVVFDLGGTGNDLVTRNFQGDCVIRNCSDPTLNHSVYFDFGSLVLDSSISAGHFDVRGHVEVDNQTTGTCTVDASEIMTVENIVKTTYAQKDSEGYNLTDALEIVRKMTHNRVIKVGNIVTVFNEDETEWETFDLTNGGRVEV